MPIASNQIVNQAAKIRYMFGGKPTLPIVYRGGKSIGAQHSQSLEAWFVHVPGLKVVMPATPYDAKGLVKTAIREDNPVVFVEHMLLYKTEGEVPEEEYYIPFGLADIKRQGSDITILATSRMVHLALEAADELVVLGFEAEVIDPRTLVPFDWDTVLRSVRKTGRLLVVHDACRTGGIGTEIAAHVQEAAFDFLDVPVARVGGFDIPMPCSSPLERLAIPDRESIKRQALCLLAGKRGVPDVIARMGALAEPPRGREEGQLRDHDRAPSAVSRHHGRRHGSRMVAKGRRATYCGRHRQSHYGSGGDGLGYPLQDHRRCRYQSASR
jgi:pyruvate/2-oxoglutarate/acetoin dehydrogenase E1 component